MVRVVQRSLFFQAEEPILETMNSSLLWKRQEMGEENLVNHTQEPQTPEAM